MVLLLAVLIAGLIAGTSVRRQAVAHALNILWRPVYCGLCSPSGCCIVQAVPDYNLRQGSRCEYLDIYFAPYYESRYKTKLVANIVSAESLIRLGEAQIANHMMSPKTCWLLMGIPGLFGMLKLPAYHEILRII